MEVQCKGEVTSEENWREKVQLKKDELENYIQNKKNNLLLLHNNFFTKQKIDIICKNLSKEASITVQPDGVIRYGDTIQIVNPEFLTTVSVVPHEDIHNFQTLGVGCVLSGSKNHTPCVRNVFKIMSLKLDVKNKPLIYGEDFLIATIHDNQIPLYVQSEIPNMNSNMGHSKHPKVTLTDTVNFHCRWSIMAFNKNEREDLFNSVVKANVPIRINQSASNQQLAFESQFRIKTIFGAEQELSVHTYLNIHKFERPENAWIFQAPTHVNSQSEETD